MALSDAERKRRSRERQAEAQKLRLKETPAVPSYLTRSFADFIGADRILEFDENLDAFGLQFAGSGLDKSVQDFPSQYVRDAPITALERAIGMVEVMLDGAKELAHLINVYKLEEIDRAIEKAEEEATNLPKGDVDALRQAFARIDRLKRIQTDLRKPTRHTVLGIQSPHEF